MGGGAKRCYPHTPFAPLRRPHAWHRNCAVTRDGFIVDERCCFGSAADATKCARASSLLVHRARLALQRFDAAHPPRDPKVAQWLRERRAAGEALGCSDVEIVERWACLHALGMYIDDAGLISIDDAVFDSSGAPVMRRGGCGRQTSSSRTRRCCPRYARGSGISARGRSGCRRCRPYPRPSRALDRRRLLTSNG